MTESTRFVYKLPSFLLKVGNDPNLHDGESLVQRLIDGDSRTAYYALKDIEPVDLAPCYEKKYPRNWYRGYIYLRHARNTISNRLAAEAAKKRNGYHPRVMRPDYPVDNRTLPYYANEPLPECFADMSAVSVHVG